MLSGFNFLQFLLSAIELNYARMPASAALTLQGWEPGNGLMVRATALADIGGFTDNAEYGWMMSECVLSSSIAGFNGMSLVVHRVRKLSATEYVLEFHTPEIAAFQFGSRTNGVPINAAVTLRPGPLKNVRAQIIEDSSVFNGFTSVDDCLLVGTLVNYGHSNRTPQHGKTFSSQGATRRVSFEFRVEFRNFEYVGGASPGQTPESSSGQQAISDAEVIRSITNPFLASEQILGILASQAVLDGFQSTNQARRRWIFDGESSAQCEPYSTMYGPSDKAGQEIMAYGALINVSYVLRG